MEVFPLIREAIIILIVSVVLASASYVIRPVNMNPGSGGSTTGAGDEESGAIQVVTLEDARRHFEQGTALFADARPQDAFRSGRIQGAINLDPNEFDDWSGNFFSKTPPDQIIITYCEGDRCTLSLELAEKLTWMGYEKVYYLKNGWGEWKDLHLPMEQSSD